MIDQAMRRVEAIRQETASHVFANVSNLHEQVLTRADAGAKGEI